MTRLLSASVEAPNARPELYNPILGDLEEVERILTAKLANPHAGVSALVEHIRRYRGKRLRPALLLLVGRACGRVAPAHHVLGAVVEMVHTATLVHDDVLDGATIRRHVPTVNAAWNNQTNILLGDYLFTHAFHLSATLDDVRGCRIIGEATNRVCEGELRQGLERGNLDLGEDEYLEIIDGKTAALIECCGRLGALFAGQPTAVVEALARFGRWLGIAFQIADDLLDLVGEEKATGKSLGTDLAQQKMTLPLIRLLATAPAGLVPRLRELLSAPDGPRMATLRQHLADSDALDYALKRAEEFTARARQELGCLPSSPSRAILETLTERAVHRSA